VALRDILAVFDVQITGVDRIKAADKAMSQITDKFRDLGQALTGGAVILGIKNFVQGQSELALNLDQTARILGVTTDELQQFHLAAELSNTSVEAVDSALRFLNRTIGSEGGHGIGAKGAKELGALGISLRDAAGKSRPVIDVFADLADKLKKTGDQGKATEIAMQVLGRGGARSLPLLMQGGEALRAKFAELRKLGGGISPESIAAAKKLQVEEVRLKYATESVKSELMAGFVPALTRGIEKLVSLTVAFKEAADKTTFFKTFPLFVYAGGIAAGILSVVKAVRLLTWALTGINLSVPWMLALVAAAGLLYAAFDDIVGLFSGNQSLIGYIIDTLYGEGTSTKKVEEIKEAWEHVMNAFSYGSWQDFFDALRDELPETIQRVEALAKAVGLVWDAAKGDANLIIDSVKDSIDDINAGLNLVLTPGKDGNWDPQRLKDFNDAMNKGGQDFQNNWNQTQGAVDTDKAAMFGDEDAYQNRRARRNAANAVPPSPLLAPDWVHAPPEQLAGAGNLPAPPLPQVPAPPAPQVNLTVHVSGVKDPHKAKVTVQNNNAFPAVNGT
jgi:hypothetical protein